jgi:hypothetical protein
LVVSVWILESRRGIAEAESVAKLTELGLCTQRYLLVRYRLSILIISAASSISMASYGLHLVFRSSHLHHSVLKERSPPQMMTRGAISSYLIS